MLWSVHLIYFQGAVLMISYRLSTGNMAVVWRFGVIKHTLNLERNCT